MTDYWGLHEMASDLYVTMDFNKKTVHGKCSAEKGKATVQTHTGRIQNITVISTKRERLALLTRDHHKNLFADDFRQVEWQREMAWKGFFVCMDLRFISETNVHVSRT